jgi:NAD(P)-dependent dehydrogenase (short-subunit alcohol dehydrogenase family)
MDSNVALVTGASRGIGAGVARRLASAGYFTVLAARGVEGCEAVLDEIRAAGGDGAALSLDLGDRAALPAFLEGLEAEVGPRGGLGLLVNNAGIAQSAPFAPKGGGHADEAADRHLEINFHGPRRLIEALAPGMVARGSGAVVNVASSAALRGYGYVSAYCASKHALLGYARAVAEELGPKGVAVHTLCPHYVDSPMLQASIDNVVAKTGKSPEEARAFFAAQNPGGGLVSVDDVAAWTERLATEPGARVVELDGARAFDVPIHSPTNT